MNAEIENLSHPPEVNQPSAPLRAVVFGSQPKVLKQMSDQLFRKKILARMVGDEKLLLSTLSEFDPDLVFIEINGETRSPVEQIVKVVFMWTKNYARRVNKALNSPSSLLWDKARVVLYKSESENVNINPSGIEITDLDEVLFKCKDAGDVIYIGLYATWSFYSKLEPLLVKAP